MWGFIYNFLRNFSLKLIKCRFELIDISLSKSQIGCYLLNNGHQEGALQLE